ncbi:MAG TPA: hypothetical protein VK760_07205 [Candidatus Acidoferrales bacterium]|nr:hypothetical protein [Candidatus Acidoferrales bacterium]
MRLLERGDLSDAGANGHGASVAYVRDCIGAFGAKAIRNVRTEMHVLDTGRHTFPVSVNAGDEEPENSYVVSPLTAYSGYARDELNRNDVGWFAAPLRLLTNVSGAWLSAARIDRLVQVNNWLLSTNLYPSNWNGEDLEAITALLTERWRDHAIGFRSLNAFSNPLLLEHLRLLGYVALPSRQVYIFDGRAGDDSSFSERHNLQIDMRLLRRGAYRVVREELTSDADFERLEELYNLLYLDKYCRLNPQFTAAWLRCGQRDGWLELTTLRNADGRIDGVAGWFAMGGIISAPIVGYDTGLPAKAGLYRMLTALCIEEAARRRCVLNFSSGAAHFKRLRGGVPEIEYSMVYVRHLPARRRVVWHALAAASVAVAAPVLKAFRL